jgi:predicted ABC-class ATPase
MSCGAIIGHIMSPRPGVVAVSAPGGDERIQGRAFLALKALEQLCPSTNVNICLFSWLGLSSTRG